MLVGNQRIRAEPAWVLHRRPYSESSLLLELFSRHHGRLAVIAKGGRRQKSPLRGLLAPFQPLSVGWSGRGEVKTLTGAEQDAALAPLRRTQLFCGYYLNELLLKLLHRYDAHEALFDFYRQALVSLTQIGDCEKVLRIFEKHLLEQVGYGMQLRNEYVSGESLAADRLYRYVPDVGPLADIKSSSDGVLIHGAALLALDAENELSGTCLSELKQLSRVLLDHSLDGRGLSSRTVYGRVSLSLDPGSNGVSGNVISGATEEATTKE
ncbi:MAG: DNA repair protein RecO [Arenicellales bacterium]|nr:DNA repair protein RecO [Arenicellales bacterium]